MKVITPGHRYELGNFENKRGLPQVLQFIQKEPADFKLTGDIHALRTVRDGTTNEEVLAVLIDRLDFLYAKLPSKQTASAKACLEIAMDLLETRTKDRIERKVEGTAAA